jgi:hypothetical protein
VDEEVLSRMRELIARLPGMDDDELLSASRELRAMVSDAEWERFRSVILWIARRGDRARVSGYAAGILPLKPDPNSNPHKTATESPMKRVSVGEVPRCKSCKARAMPGSDYCYGCNSE